LKTKNNISLDDRPPEEVASGRFENAIAVFY